MAPADAAQRKDEILTATFDLIARGGIEAATMRQVAASVDATTGRVTHHFPSRVELLVATLAEVERRRMVRIATHVDLEPSALLRAPCWTCCRSTPPGSTSNGCGCRCAPPGFLNSATKSNARLRIVTDS